MFLKSDVNDEQRLNLDAALKSDDLVQSYELETKEKRSRSSRRCGATRPTS